MGAARTQWSETWVGGSAEAERVAFAALARQITEVQRRTARAASAHGVPHGVDRAFHAKATLAVPDAVLRFRNDLPADLRVGFAQPGASYPVTARFSNASGTGRPDPAPDLRGVALRVTVSAEESHDLLMTNFPVSHARDARQFVDFATATAGSTPQKVVGLVRLVTRHGIRETVRMLRNIRNGRGRTVASIVTESYWSRGALRWGDHAVRYLLRPAADTPPAPSASSSDPAYLSKEVARRLAVGDVSLELCVQRYVDDRQTPIEDTAVAWTEAVSPPVPVAVLTLRQSDVTTVGALAHARVVDAMAFNPWNTTDDFRPLGNLNRARKAAYDASSAHRLGHTWTERPPLRNVVLGAGVRAGFGVLNRRIEWHRLPVPLGLLNLDAFRHQLRVHNLLDTETPEAPPEPRPVPPAAPAEETRTSRSVDGSANDLASVPMGATGATFGRNLAPRLRPDLFDEPNPVEVSRALLYREHFIPARSLNILAAAWIQFQVHDWVAHARHPLGVDDVTVRLPRGMTWSNTPGGPAEREMRIAGNVPHPGGHPAMAPVFANTTSHWWDGSEVYGADSERATLLREGAKLRLTSDGYLPDDASGQELTGFNESWWMGLGSLHTLFAREHNLLCDELRAHYRGWSDERVHQTARLVVSALIAKIHTVEWTPAILATEGDRHRPDQQLERTCGQRLGDPTGHVAGGRPLRRRHPEDQARPSRGAVLPDRGLRDGLPAAPADPRRLPVRRPRQRSRARAAHVRGSARQVGRRRAARARAGQRALLLRHRPPGGDHPAQLPALAPGLRAGR